MCGSHDQVVFRDAVVGQPRCQTVSRALGNSTVVERHDRDRLLVADHQGPRPELAVDPFVRLGTTPITGQHNRFGGSRIHSGGADQDVWLILGQDIGG